MNTNQATASTPPLPVPSPIQSGAVAAAVAESIPELYFSDDGLTIKRLDKRQLTAMDLNMQRALQVQLLGLLQSGIYHETGGIFSASKRTRNSMSKSFSMQLKNELRFLSEKRCNNCTLGYIRSAGVHKPELHQASVKHFYPNLILIQVLEFLEHILKLESPLNMKKDLIALFSMKISRYPIKFIMFLSQKNSLSLIYDKGPTFEQDVHKLIETMIAILDRYELQATNLALLVAKTD